MSCEPCAPSHTELAVQLPTYSHSQPLRIQLQLLFTIKWLYSDSHPCCSRQTDQDRTAWWRIRERSMLLLSKVATNVFLHFTRGLFVSCVLSFHNSRSAMLRSSAACSTIELILSTVCWAGCLTMINRLVQHVKQAKWTPRNEEGISLRHRGKCGIATNRAKVDVVSLSVTLPIPLCRVFRH